VLFVVLLVFPRRYLVEHVRVAPVARNQWVTPAPLQIGGGLVLLVALALVPSFAGVHIIDWTSGVAMIVLFLALGLLVRTAGQVSLCHVSFMAIGVAMFGHMTADWGVPWFAAFVLSSLVLVPVGAIIAIPAIRLSPLYLALATLGFAIFLQYMFYTQTFMFGVAGAGIDIPRPALFSSDNGYYYLVLGLAVLASLAVVALNRTRLGRLLRGIADSPMALDTNGASTKVTWVLLFCLSAVLAGAAGILGAAAQGNVGALNYDPVLSLTYLALVIIVVGDAPWYAVAAGLGLVVPPSYLSGDTTTHWLQLVFGVSAILYAITPDERRGAPAPVRRVLDGLFRRSATSAPSAAAAAQARGARASRARDRILEVRGITVRFGGLVAVNGATMQVTTGKITGLIGPNGAGKTTLFNVCSGLVAPASGTVFLDEHALGRSPSAARARRGLGRTFQQMQLMESRTVWENVAIGVEGGLAGANALRHVIPRLHDGRRVRAATAEALELCGLLEHAQTQVSVLSTGQRRLVELARCLAGPFDILLLDEPSSGLDQAETAEFASILERAVHERGVGILLVEHDMSLVMRVCDYIYVLDFGNPVFDGDPRSVRESPVVRAAYLGGDEVEAVIAGEEA
jgi:ABC-type branched-subunit amino acid transport system ATPase component/ABC-type branched-subunit amino acid transport system permease subunit